MRYLALVAGGIFYVLVVASIAEFVLGVPFEAAWLAGTALVIGALAWKLGDDDHA